jgi:D-lactate dehydrogenase
MSASTDITKSITHNLYYGHLFCHVFHQDYIVRKGHDSVELEPGCGNCSMRGAEYPAEHNFGHLYNAKPAPLDHCNWLDPCNCFDPGIGRTSKHPHWLQP